MALIRSKDLSKINLWDGTKLSELRIPYPDIWKRALPYLVGCNFYTDMFKVESIEWIREYDLVSEKILTILVKSDVAELCKFAFPAATLYQTRTLLDMYNWIAVYDDYFDNELTAENAIQLAESIAPYFQDGGTLVPVKSEDAKNKWGEALHDCLRRMQKTGLSNTQTARYLGELGKYTASTFASSS